MTGQSVLVIHLNLGADMAKAQKFVEDIVQGGATVTVLASSETASIYANFEVSTWPDGAPRGVLRLLALVRRISWGQFVTIYDLEDSPRSRAYRWFIRPRPRWVASPLECVPLDRVQDGTACPR